MRRVGQHSRMGKGNGVAALSCCTWLSMLSIQGSEVTLWHKPVIANRTEQDRNTPEYNIMHQTKQEYGLCRMRRISEH